MIIRDENTLKTEQADFVNLNDDAGNSLGTNYYREVLGLSSNALSNSYNHTNLIPNRLKWGSTLISIVD